MKSREIKGKEERVVVLTVNQRVSGSSPEGGAKKSTTYKVANGDFVVFASS